MPESRRHGIQPPLLLRHGVTKASVSRPCLCCITSQLLPRPKHAALIRIRYATRDAYYPNARQSPVPLTVCWRHAPPALWRGFLRFLGGRAIPSPSRLDGDRPLSSKHSALCHRDHRHVAPNLGKCHQNKEGSEWFTHNASHKGQRISNEWNPAQQKRPSPILRIDRPSA